ncbi:hypothetical protein BKA65DRAFT_547280 [Rhexocercosporidium sp. MPI-PUGE-AT-0058]|nr:hypothetical protein BKA65DRAFT_547280 [Rhexocercosporidium sp. MPI-PUGE-AT-0058]
MATQLQPTYIVSVNNTPQRAKELVAILIDELQPQYNLIHLANTESIFGVKTMLESLVVVPEVLICSSQWSIVQQNEVQKLAKGLIRGLKTVAIPPGLNALEGGDAVVGFLKEQFLGLGLPTRS